MGKEGPLGSRVAVRVIIAAIILMAAFDLALAVFPPVSLMHTALQRVGGEERRGYCHFAGEEIKVQQKEKHSRPYSGRTRI